MMMKIKARTRAMLKGLVRICTFVSTTSITSFLPAERERGGGGVWREQRGCERASRGWRGRGGVFEKGRA